MTVYSRRMTGVVLASYFLVTAAAHAATESVLHRFAGGGDGAMPVADLLSVHGTLYGTTEYGGSGSCMVFGYTGCGTVFSVTPRGTQPAAETVVHAFQGGADGAYPKAGLIKVGGTFYGTTSAGGASGNGTVFSLTPEGVETVLCSFKGFNDGAQPYGGLIDVDGTLYGTTVEGGTGGRGTMYSITTAGVEKVLHNFGLGGDGAYPEADLINVDGTLYGITYKGGSGGAGCGGPCGTVYSITTAGSETILHSFQGGSDGEYPQGQAHLLNIGGTLYGTTFGGGHHRGGGDGVVFSVTPAGIEKVVYAFTGRHGDSYPLAGLTAMGTTYYGTTGGFSGAVYSITPDGVTSVVYSFTGGDDGYAPYAGLTKMRTKLYGTTAGGGGNGCPDFYGCGTVFSVHP